MSRATRTGAGLLLAALCFVSGAARADNPPTKAPLKDAPRPDEASGITTPDDVGDEWMIWIPRVIFGVPRVAIEGAAAPLRLLIWASDKYEVAEKLSGLFTGVGPVGIIPLVQFETGFGVTYGAMPVFNDIGGTGARLRGRFLFGGDWRRVYGLKFTTGRLLGDFTEATLRIEYQELNNQRFNGFGVAAYSNANGTPQSVYQNRNVEAFYDFEFTRGQIDLAFKAHKWLNVVLSTSISRGQFKAARDLSETDVAEAFDVDTLVGYNTGLASWYGEVSFQLDTRHQDDPYLPGGLLNDGVVLNAYLGYAAGFSGDPTNYPRLGLDFQWHIDAFQGDRVLVLRAFWDAIFAPMDQIPFIDLPSLGGSRILRGYLRNRFRNRQAAALSAEWRFPVSRSIQGYVFGDMGTVWRNLDDFQQKQLRAGGGVGLAWITEADLLFRVQLAGGSEGLTVDLTFQPFEDVDDRRRWR